MNKLLTKSQLAVFSFIFFLLLAVTSPFWLWQLKANHPFSTLILGNDSENQGLAWLFNHEKAKKFSFLPNDQRVSTNYDVYYLADHEGSLNKEQLSELEKALIHSSGKTVISEYSTLASASTGPVSEKVKNLFNINWNGWAGKYFSDLASAEIPSWVKKNYEGKWTFNGSGIILVNQDGFVIVIEQKDLTGEGISFQYTKKGEKLLGSKLAADYKGWFQLVEARDEDEVAAVYQMPVSKEAKARLKSLGLPAQFPAVVLQQTAKYTSYYFAGDFSVEADAPGIYQTKGISWWKQHMAADDSFYWKAYVPMMKGLLANGLDLRKDQKQVEIMQIDGVQLNSRTNENSIQIQKNGQWENILVKGVNMGIAKPGTFPGETGITKDEYFRWFKAIGAMNANAIRVYTIHPPAFYEAFYEYNLIAEKPLYLFHGAWVNEENLVHYQDAFHPEVTDDFKQEIKHIIDIVHGQAKLPERPGHASGEYKYNISPYVLGFIIGIEWDPQAVVSTNEKHKGMKAFAGEFFRTHDASPFEIWLTQLMEFTTAYGMKTYQWQHSMSFTNWVTTDLLTHPAEPSENEDMVTVDPNHIIRTTNFHAGLFASYHVYPYYPDFLNYEKKYTEYIDSEGKKNNYAGYLHDLLSAHEMPVLIAEFGVPESRGLTHVNVDGMDQGFHSEKEQGEINKRLFESIVSEGAAGGLVFSWQDEWFKRTWNTMDYDNPDRRPFWSNRQTNEQHFGLLSFEPGAFEAKIYVDGDTADWEKMRAKPVYEDPSNAMYITSDEEDLFIRLDSQKPIDPNQINTDFLIDTIHDQGQTSLSLQNGKEIRTNFGVDFHISLSDRTQSRILIDSYYDSFYYHYGNLLKMIPKVDYASQKNNGIFHPIRLALNKELTIPSTGEKQPFLSYETGKLMFGNGNPLHQDFDSLTDISISKDRKTIELRLPWAILNMKDPSQKEVIGNLWEKGLTSSEKIKGIRLAVVMTDQDGKMTSFPKMTNGMLLAEDTATYTWDNWDQPAYHERLKDSYWIMKEVFQNH
ncbi:hypothetical protein F7731_08945 [Cytobacillus depressus]|uniref:Family 2 glycosyl transferase n=1 Tax=Cytobacillus depressus TaxID=1602942 RepID=A0A6L3VBA8_9BACI|nr:hypothetical protein [Cytobacillus depressus]KAB2336493.1 hypothetical protein F7731_08945 [Cytobacillus depressus]